MERRVSLSEQLLRANPDYELVSLEHLEADLRERALAAEPELYGVLKARGETRLPSLAVSCDTALLLFSLREPSRLPGFFKAQHTDDAEDSVRKLVLDRVLEVVLDGAPQSGPGVLERVRSRAPLPVSSALEALSRAALDYGAALATSDVEELALSLYRYNTAPRTPALVDELGEAGALARWLDLGGALGRALAGRFVEQAPKGTWRAFTARARETLQSRHRATYKLYVSPTLEALPTALPRVVESFAEAGVSHWKLGRTLDDLLRPDKLVAYFADEDALLRAARAAMSALTDVPAEGVPFTGPVDARGLLSWGLDPSRRAATRGRSLASYRVVVTGRLSAHLAEAKEHGLAEPAEYALERLRLEGFDTRTWAPRARAFKALDLDEETP